MVNATAFLVKQKADLYLLVTLVCTFTSEAIYNICVCMVLLKLSLDKVKSLAL